MSYGTWLEMNDIRREHESTGLRINAMDKTRLEISQNREEQNNLLEKMWSGRHEDQNGQGSPLSPCKSHQNTVENQRGETSLNKTNPKKARSFKR